MRTWCSVKQEMRRLSRRMGIGDCRGGGDGGGAGSAGGGSCSARLRAG